MLYIMRHGRTDWNEMYKLQGSVDIPLNDTGRQMALEAGEKYQDMHIDVCYCSPLSRARETAELVLKDREMLSNNGIVIISATIDKKSKAILSGPEILTRGFIYVKDSQDLINSIKKMSSSIIVSNVHNNYIDYSKVKNTIRENLSKYLFEQTGNRPMIITVIQEI